MTTAAPEPENEVRRALQAEVTRVTDRTTRDLRRLEFQRWRYEQGHMTDWPKYDGLPPMAQERLAYIVALLHEAFTEGAESDVG